MNSADRWAAVEPDSDCHRRGRSERRWGEAQEAGTEREAVEGSQPAAGDESKGKEISLPATPNV